MVAPARRRHRRVNPRPEAVAVLCGLAGFGLQVVIGWPGWMSADTVAIQSEATAGPVTDWYPPMLTWLWSLLQPDGGLLPPFLLQLELFWIGVTLVAIGLQPSARWTRFLPALMLLNPAIWALLVVTPEAALLSLLTLAFGVATLAVRAYRRGTLAGARTALWMAAVLVGAAAATYRHMLVPALLLTLALCLALLPRQLPRRTRGETTAKALVLTLVTGLLVAVSAPAAVIGDVTATRIDESSFALDAYHVDCAATWSGTRPATPVSPPGLWRSPAAPCDEGPGSYGTAWSGYQDPTGEQVLSLRAWFGILLADPGVVIGGRVQQLAGLWGSPAPGAPDIDGGELVAAQGAGGVGESVAEPNRGGILLAVHAAVTSFIPAQLFLWISLLPVAAGIWVRRQWRGQPRSVVLWPTLLFPSGMGVVMGLLAPTTGTAALVPAAMLGWVFALWVAALGSFRIAAFSHWRKGEATISATPYPTSQPGRQRRKKGAVQQQSTPRRGLRRRLPRRPANDAPVVAAPERTAPAAAAATTPPGVTGQQDLGPAPLSAFLAEQQSQPVDLREERDRKGDYAGSDPST